MATVACVGHTHEVIKQSKAMSCGPTCVQMAHLKIKGTPFSEVLVFSVTSLLEMPLSKSYDGTSPTHASNLATLAKGIGLNASFQSCKTLSEFLPVLGLVGTTYPCVIAHVQWFGMGGHFVMIDKSKVDLGTLKQTICVCDPYDGAVHRVPFDPYETKGVLRYTAPSGIGYFSGGIIKFGWS